jgi:hypothetical protein
MNCKGCESKMSWPNSSYGPCVRMGGPMETDGALVMIADRNEN